MQTRLLARRTHRALALCAPWSLVYLPLLCGLWLGASCSGAAPDTGEETSAAVDPCGIVTTPNTTYTYVEPRLAAQSTLNVGQGTSAGPVLLASAGNAAIYLANQQDTSAHPHAQVIYKSVDQGTSWQQQGMVSLPTGACTSCLGVTPRAVGTSTQQRLILGAIACNGSGSTPCVGVNFVSDDGGSSWSQAANSTQPFATDYCSCSLAPDDLGSMHMVYSVNSTSNPNALWHNQSSNGGASWGTNTQIATVSILPRWPSIAATGVPGNHQMVIVYEQEQPDSATRWEVGSIVSNDNGGTWSLPIVVLAPSGDDMLSAPSAAALDAHTVAVTYVHVVGNHNQEVSRDVGLAFGRVQSRNTPVFGPRLSLGACATFPASVLVLPNNMLLVVTRTAAGDGPFLTRLTLSR